MLGAPACSCLQEGEWGELLTKRGWATEAKVLTGSCIKLLEAVWNHALAPHPINSHCTQA